MRHPIFLLIIVVFSGLFGGLVSAFDKLQSDDLSNLAVTAQKHKLPILLIVSQHHCPFCVKLKEEIIFPMQISGDYNDKVIIAEILLDSYKDIIDFKGNLTKPIAIASGYKVWVTPTLLFLNHNGKEIHKRMLGVNTIEMYGYYLDESLTAALKAIHNDDHNYIATQKDILGDAPGYDQVY